MTLSRSLVLRLVATGAVAVCVVGAIALFLHAPTARTTGAYVEVEEGSTLSEIAAKLKEENIIRSSLLFQSIVLLKDGERGVVAGEYRFFAPENSSEVAERLLAGEYGIDLYTITVPEGLTARVTARLLGSRIPEFDAETFSELAVEHEGYLFPATYTFPVDVTPKEAIDMMRNTFDERIAELEGMKDRREKNEEEPEDVEDTGEKELSKEEIIVLASIIEKEAITADSKRIVSGILQNRLEDGMPLQVDAAFLYIDGLSHKTSATLTMNDLALESPYNTYTQEGLPPTPIANPGITSIRAALDPLQSDYFFYLNDLRGNMYYATDFEEHKKNRVYLDI